MGRGVAEVTERVRNEAKNYMELSVNVTTVRGKAPEVSGFAKRFLVCLCALCSVSEYGRLSSLGQRRVRQDLTVCKIRIVFVLYGMRFV